MPSVLSTETDFIYERQAKIALIDRRIVMIPELKISGADARWNDWPELIPAGLRVNIPPAGGAGGG